jgi:site-specific DNA recombinase
MVESAKSSAERTQYREGLSFALKHKVRHIIFYIFDRETRNLTDNEQNELLVKQGKIVLHYVRERRVFHVKSSDSDFFLRDVQAVTNKQFIRQLRTKIMDGLVNKAEGGWFPAAKPPLGYKTFRPKKESGLGDASKAVIIIDENEKTVRQVQREFELRANGYSLAQIRKQIIAEGFIPAGKISTYGRSIIEYRLKCEFYRGTFTWQGIKYNGKHDLIIPRAVIEAVDRSFGVKGALRKHDSHDDFGIFGAGWIKCAQEDCGCHIVYDPKTKRIKGTGELRVFHYYHCTNSKRVHPSLKGFNVPEKVLWDAFGFALDDITLSEERAGEIAKALNKAHDRIQEARKREIENYREALVVLEQNEDSAYQDLRRGVLDDTMYQRQLTRMREERKRFTMQLEEANRAIDGTYLKTAQTILELATKAKRLWNQRSAHERFELLNRILSNPRLDGTSVRYDLKKPYCTLKKLGTDESWMSYLDSFRTDLISVAA